MNNKETTIIVYAGEHSYELCWFTTKMRKLCKEQFKDAYKIAISRFGKNGLYRDFVDEFIPFPQKIENKLGYPSCGATRNRKNNVMPKEIIDPAALDFVNDLITQRDIKKPTIITSLNYPQWTGDKYNLAGTAGSKEEEPWGDYSYLNARPHIQYRVVSELEKNLDMSYPIVTIMARTRKRLEHEDTENWNPENWKTLINRLIEELGVNIVLIGVPPKNEEGYPGALTFKPIQKRLYSMVRNCEDSVEEQIAVLKNTQCSIYGSSGASYLTMFCNTPSFIISQSEDGWRLSHKWCLTLTNNHEKVKILGNTKPGKDYWNMNPDDIYKEFYEFYKGLENK